MFSNFSQKTVLDLLDLLDLLDKVCKSLIMRTLLPFQGAVSRANKNPGPCPGLISYNPFRTFPSGLTNLTREFER